MEKCIGCELCAGVCPAKCIYVRGADNDPDDPTSPGERFGFVYEINYLRCIHCDLCVEACPTEAITESKVFEFSFTNRQDAIYTKAELVVGDDGRPQHMPWEDWREGEDAKTSGWVRATAPSGSADFVGLVGWSGELGYGVRAREPRREMAALAELPRTTARPRTAAAPRTASSTTADVRRRRSSTAQTDASCASQRCGSVADAAVRLRHRVGDGARWRARRDRVPAPGARRAQPGADAVRRGRALRGHGGPLPGRRAGHRLRRRDRRAVPVRDHAARRRPGRRPARRARCRSSGRWPR